MSQLVPLDAQRHQHLHVTANARMQHAATQHMVHVRVSEIPKTVSSLPVFFSKNAQNGQWTLSAISSFVPGHNLFVSDNQWQALYLPDSLAVYPLYLMKADNEKGFQAGIVEDSDAFSDQPGDALYDQNGKPTLYLTDLQKRLENTVTEDMRTYQFAKRLDAMGLIKSVDLVLHYADGQQQVLSGLHTINEDALQQLDAKNLQELHALGYLAAINAMLVSIFQLNRLVVENNRSGKFPTVQQVRLEIARDRSAA